MLKFDLNRIKDIGAEARRLMAEGVPDQPFEGWRGDMKCLTGRSLKTSAEHSIREQPRLAYTKYYPDKPETED